MRNTPQNRRRAILLPLGLLMLSLAVFGWGLQYKLSLYQGKDSVSHLAPVAKLLSQKERPAAAQLSDVTADRTPAWPVLLILIPLLGLCQTAAQYLRDQRAEKSQPPLPACLRTLFLRPPPASPSPS